MSASLCAAFDCSNCSHFLAQQCLGCEEGNKALMRESNTVCAIYFCAREQGLSSCEECLRLPCLFLVSERDVCPARARFESVAELGFSLQVLTRQLASAGGVLAARLERIPEKSILRASHYIGCLQKFVKEGKDSVSSFELAEEAKVKATLVRKDLSYFGEFGSREGYPSRYLLSRLRGVLKLDVAKPSAWVGADRLRGDLEMLDRFRSCGFQVIAVFDADPAETGGRIGALEVQSLDSLPTEVERLKLSTGIIAVPPTAAQECADSLLAAGINYLLNLSAAWVKAPPNALVRNCNLLGELCVLSYAEQAPARQSAATAVSAALRAPEPAKSD